MANQEHLAILQQGVEAWNTWRASQLAERPALSGEALAGADIPLAEGESAPVMELAPVDLAGTNLTGADLAGVNLRNADLRNADLRHAKLGGADLRNARLNFADMNDADLRGADLSGADLTGAKLDGVKLDGVNLADARLFVTRLGNIAIGFGGTRRGVRTFDPPSDESQVVDAVQGEYEEPSTPEEAGEALAATPALSLAMVYWEAERTATELAATQQEVAELRAELQERDASLEQMHFQLQSMQAALHETEQGRADLAAQLDLRLAQMASAYSELERREAERQEAERKEIERREKARRYHLSCTRRKHLSKGLGSRFLIVFYLPEAGDKVSELQRQYFRPGSFGETTHETKAPQGATVTVELSSPTFDFGGKKTVTLDEDVKPLIFLGTPKDNCKAGAQDVLLTISDAASGVQYNSYPVQVQVVNYQCDHLPQPWFQWTAATVAATVSATMYILALLKAIDDSLGYVSGTAALAISGIPVFMLRRLSETVTTILS